MSRDDVFAYPWSFGRVLGQNRSASALPLQADNKLPAIQALRGVAVLLVVLFHALTRYVPFGWVGVWLFFAISGFVITLSLEKLSSRSDASRIVRIFYEKRARRIIPLYIVILLAGCLICAGMALAGRADVPPALDHLPYLVSFTYNFYRMSGAYEHTELFGHLWSLCVEEQFYIVYPFIFLFLSRRARIWLLSAIMLICPAGRLCLNLYLSKHGYSEQHIAAIVYLGPVGNFDVFAAGCLAASLREHAARLGAAWWLSVAAALIASLVFYLSIQTLVLGASFADVASSAFAGEARGAADQVFVYSFLALFAGTLVTVCANCQQSRALLGMTAPLVWLGELSYGIYMYHFPLLYLRYQFLPGSLPGPYAKLYGSGVLMLYLVSLLAISYVSFRYLERPFLSPASPSRRQKV